MHIILKLYSTMRPFGKARLTKDEPFELTFGDIIQRHGTIINLKRQHIIFIAPFLALICRTRPHLLLLAA